MSSSPKKPIFEPLVKDVGFTSNALIIVLSDGREIRMLLECSARLRKATIKLRESWELIGEGVEIHWESIDEDI